MLAGERYGVPRSKLVLAPFFAPPSAHAAAEAAASTFAERQHVLMIGNFRHPPNLDSVRWAATEVWPLVRRVMPHIELHVFGAYPTGAAQQLHNPVSSMGGWVRVASSVCACNATALVMLRPCPSLCRRWGCTSGALRPRSM